MIPTWFLYVAGFSMVMLGILQIQQRPRAPGDSFYRRFVNVGTLWSLLCISVGMGLLLMALGYWEGPLSRPAPAPRKHARHRAGDP
jgi:hypothetical protein